MNKERSYKNKDWLAGKYLKEKLSIYEIARICGCHPQTIWRVLIEFDIPRRSAKEYRIGKKHSLKTRRKMSLSAIKRSRRPGYKAKQSRAHMGIKHSEETKRKLSLIRRGREHPWQNGVTRPDEVREKVSLSLKTRYRDKEFKEKAIKALMRNRSWLPTSDEKKIIALCKKHKSPFEYIGDGKLIIEGKIPDFIDTRSKKLLIELYEGPSKNYEKKRIDHFAPLGFKILFLTKKDLKGKNWETICLQKIQKFIGDKKCVHFQ